jgi:hypothetical protein
VYSVEVTNKGAGQMTDKKKYQQKMSLMCTDALLNLAHKHQLNVQQVNDQTQIVGPNGYISDVLHGDTLHDKNFEPGHGTEKDWKDLIENPYLAYVFHASGHGSFSFADNFSPTDEKAVSDVFANLRIAPK